jgi:prepilin-type N-terminal cleavage/methylation domain-containing protein
MNRLLAHRLRPRRGGFTLIEVLATMVFIGIVLPAVVTGISVANSAGGLARNKLEAVSLAQQKLDDLVVELVGQSAMTDSQSGDFSAEGFPTYNYSWEYYGRTDLETATSANLGYGVMGVSELVVHVTWSSRGQERMVTVSTLVYPPDAQAAAQEQLQQMGGGQ